MILTEELWCTVLETKDELFSVLCSSFDEERPEVPMLFRDVPSLLIIFVLTMPQPLRKGTACKATSWHDIRGRRVGGRGPLSGFFTRTAQLSVVIRAECCKETFHISYQCSYCGCLVLKVRDRRPWWWEGCSSSMCPSLPPGYSARKGAGPPIISPAYLGHALMQVDHFSNEWMRLERTYETWTLESLPL